MRRHTERGHLSWVAALGLVLLVGGSVLYLREPGTVADPGAETGQVAQQPRSRPPVATEGAVLSRLERPSFKPGVPQEILVPSLGIDADVVPISTVDDTLIPPSDPQVLGWWSAGAMTGADQGSALVTGHTVHTGGGALDDLEQVEEGDEVIVRTGRGEIRYDVQSVTIYSKGRIAEDAERLFSQESQGRLVLITCEDWNGVQYLSNVVVVATPALY